MVSLYRDPLGERIFSNEESTPTKRLEFKDCESEDVANQLSQLEARIQLLEELVKRTSRSKVSS